MRTITTRSFRPIRLTSICVACWIIIDSVHGWNLSFNRRTLTTAAADASTNMPTTPAEIPPSLDILSDITQSNLQRLLAQVSETGIFVGKYFHTVYQFVLNIVLYKPPVGIVAILGFHRVYTKLTKSPTTIQEINNRENGRSKGRKFYLDMDDADYNHHGGIDHVRAKLCRFALGDRHHQVARGLDVSHRPGDSLVRLVQELASAMSLPQGTNDSNDRILLIAGTLLQVRAVDALARIARDRLLKITFRLQRTCDHYTGRLQAKKSYPNFLQQFFKESISEDQARLSEAIAAYQAELRRLGKITHILTERPGDMSQDYLIRALKETDEIKKKHKDERRDAATIWARLSGIKVPNVRQYKIRWNVEGRGRFSLRKMDRQGHIGTETATRILLSDPSNAVWLKQADQWTGQARSILGEILREIHQESIGDNLFDEDLMEQIRTEWCHQYPKGGSRDQGMWLKTLHVVDNLHSGRRIGEGKVLRLKDATLLHWTRQFDLYGIPSTLVAVYIANMIHIRLRPYWPTFKKDGLVLYATMLGIVRERFWFPARSILDDLLNKSPTMMSAFGLDIEEASLDHMLRDLGYGDGSPSMRREGLKYASERYEDALQNNLVGNLLRGKLARLMLIQVQQLKVGVLSALETIDVLMKGNRIYFSVLAGIPAVVLATYGTKFLLHFMYNIRSRDLRPVKTVHAEMKELLLHTEELLLLAKRSRGVNGTSKLVLEPSELGQLLLTVHRYLILMDYSTPPFPSGQCDVIHENLRKLFGTDGILCQAQEDRQRTMWIQLVQKKHQELLKYI